MKKILVSLLAIALAIQATPAQSAPGDSWVPDVQNTASGSARFFIAEDTQGNQVSTRVGAEGINDWWCQDFDTAECAVSDPKNALNWYNQYSTLPVCKDAAQEDCVVSLGLTLPGKELVAAKFLRNVGGIKFPADTKHGLFEADTISLWDAPGAASAGGNTTYAVNVRTLSRWDAGDAKFRVESVSTTVMPYRQQSGNYSNHDPFTTKNPKLDKKTGVGISGIAQECVWNEAGNCGMLQDFVEGTKVSLAIRLSNQIGGWFKGRMSRPEFRVSPFSKTNNLLEVQAESVNVARLQTVVKKTEAPSNVDNLIMRSGIIGGGGVGKLWEGESMFTEGKGVDAFSYLDAFRGYAKDTSAGVSNIWNFATIEGGDGSGCLSDKSKVLGIVTTNSMVYDGSAPNFTNGQLTYNVGGLHFMPDGKELVSGTYDLVMRSETARCLYGFSTAPIQASISVVGDGGEAKVATTSVTEKDGWLKMAAYNFTFSTPVIKVKLTQPGKKITITCVKGKTVKKVTAVSAKCPAGYKKK